MSAAWWIRWAALVTLVMMWGSAFLLTQVALEDFTPIQITSARLWIGALTLLVTLRARGRSALGLHAPWKYFALIAVVGNCVPFLLIAWGQQFVASAEAGILMAIVPLEVIVLAHFLVPAERLRIRRLIGFALGFLGVVLLFEPASLADLVSRPGQTGKLAVLGGATCYALAAILAQRQPGRDPYRNAAGVLVSASCIMVAVLWLSGEPPPDSVSAASVLAVITLGAFATGAATVVYFFLAAEAGAGFLSLTNYLVPCVAAGLGTWIAGEMLGLGAWLALGVILVGIAVSEGAGNDGS